MKEPNEDTSKSSKKPAPAKVVDLEEIAGILEVLRANDVREFKFERGDYKLSLKRGVEESRSYDSSSHSSSAGHSSQSHFQPNYSGGGAQIVPLVRQESAAHQEAPAPVLPPKTKLKDIPSPMVGTFYRRPAVDADPYVAVGDLIKKGDVICIVEAMKIMNEIESEVAGRVAEVCLDDGQMVEYGEPLFRIEPLS